MGILMPALARVRQIAFRMVCGTNLSGIGKAMLIYANDYQDEFPRSGGQGAVWQNKLPTDTKTTGWLAANRNAAYGLSGTNTAGYGSITSSFYLLVKYAEVTPKSFICKGDTNITEFEVPNNTMDLIALWDFGDAPTTHCSYSYNQPFSTFALTTSSDPGLAVASDPTPWCKSGDRPDTDFTAFKPTGGKEFTSKGNSINHQDEGQQVLFLDSHVDFETVAFCGLNQDNIYTAQSSATGADLRIGVMPSNGGALPLNRTDNLLVSDYGTGTGTKSRSCFTADTPVWVEGQMVEISKVVAGQMVGKADCAMSTSGSIKGIEEHGAGINPCYVLTLESGNSITIVHSHYFMTVSGEWKKVEELSAGMQLQSMNGPITIKSVVKKAMPYLGNSYNLMLKGSEQYFVGKDGIVALDCSKTTWETLEKARK